MTTKEFGDFIRQTRRAQGLKQPDLAMACGTGVRFIVDLERGKESCQIGKALNVLPMLGIKMNLTSAEQPQEVAHG